MLIKQSSAVQQLVFLMIDSSDHLTGKTGLSPVVSLSKNGGSFATPVGAVSEIAHGWYKVAANASDTDTLGPLVLHATAPGSDPVDLLFEIVAYDPQDSASLGLSRLDAAITTRSTPANITSLQSHGDGSWSTATGFANASDIAAAVWDEDLAGHATTGTGGAVLASAGSAGDPWATSLPGSYTTGQAGKIIGDYLDVAVSSRSSHDASAVAGLVLLTPANKLATDTNGYVTIITNHDKTGYSLTTAPPDTGEIASAVWAASTRTLTAFSFFTSQSIADAVWDEASGDHTTTDTTGAKLAGAAAAGDPLSSAVPGEYASGTAGRALARIADIQTIVQAGSEK